MSRKSVKTKRLLSSQSLADDFTSDWINISYLDNVGFLISTSNVSDNTGEFSVEVRMVDDVNNESDPATLTLDATPALNDTDTQFLLNLNQVPANQIRLKFTAAGGTPDGTCDVYVHTKTVGA